METKAFPLRVILSCTTDRLLTKRKGDRDNGISDLYEILEWMTGEAPCTHQLPRFNDECKPWILRKHPQLSVVNERLDDLDVRRKASGDAGIEEWIRQQESEFGESLDLWKVPADDHERINAYDELVQMRGTDEGIILV